MSSGDSLLLGRLLFRLRSGLQGLGDFLLGFLGLLIVEDLTLENLVQMMSEISSLLTLESIPILRSTRFTASTTGSLRMTCPMVKRFIS